MDGILMSCDEVVIGSASCAQYYDLEFSLNKGGTIRIKTDGTIEIVGMDLPEASQMFWKVIQQSFPGWQNLNDVKEKCVCLTQDLMTAGCRCGHLKKSP